MCILSVGTCLQNGFRGNLVLSFHITPVFPLWGIYYKKTTLNLRQNIFITISFWQYLLSENTSNLLTVCKEDPRATCDLRVDRDDAGMGRETNEG